MNRQAQLSDYGRTPMNRIQTASRRFVGPLAALALVACGTGDAQPTPEADVTVLSQADLAVVRQAALRSGVTLTGTLDPYRRVDLKAQVAGTLLDVTVDPGDQVRADQPIARIEAAGIQSLAISARAAVAAAQAGVAQAEREFESARMLRDAGAMSELDYRAVQTGSEAAVAQLAAAQAQDAGASEQARRTVLRAPFAGEISAREANDGEAVRSDQILFTVVNSSILELSGHVPVAEAVRVREGQQVEFTIDAYRGQTFRGTVTHVTPVADPRTRQVAVTMRLDNPGGTLIAGLFASGRVITNTEVDALVIPAGAVRGAEGDRYVWLLADGTLVRRAVTLGVADEAEGIVAITSGLTAGDQVVTSPGEVREGSAVRIVKSTVETDITQGAA